MTLTDLYEIADENGIRVDHFMLDNQTQSLAVYFDGKYAIALDLSKLTTAAEIKTAFAHEVGHCQTHSFYNIKNHLDVRTKQEYKADKWAVHKLIPREDMQRAFMDGIVEVWELAEFFNVTEELIKKALWIYFDKN